MTAEVPANSVAFGRDGRTLAVGYDDDAVQFQLVIRALAVSRGRCAESGRRLPEWLRC
jgi:hypothetical protein